MHKSCKMKMFCSKNVDKNYCQLTLYHDVVFKNCEEYFTIWSIASELVWSPNTYHLGSNTPFSKSPI